MYIIIVFYIHDTIWYLMIHMVMIEILSMCCFLCLSIHNIYIYIYTCIPVTPRPFFGKIPVISSSVGLLITGWWLSLHTPAEKSPSKGMMTFPINMGKKHLPKHQAKSIIFSGFSHGLKDTQLRYNMAWLSMTFSSMTFHDFSAGFPSLPSWTMIYHDYCWPLFLHFKHDWPTILNNY